jgi:acetyl esterase/lipase
MRSFMLISAVCLAASAASVALGSGKGAGKPPEPQRLWEGDAPGAQGTTDADVPTITVYRPPAGKSNGAAVVVCPGGGYAGLAEHEGRPVAEWLNTLGVTGVVLKYRLGPRYHHPAMLNDVSRALRTVRFHAADWGLDPQRIGVLGFSAGGHLASTAATHFDDGDPNAADPIDRVSSRPDIAILVYPVITLSGPYAHIGSRNNLLGENPPQELIDLLSNEKQVTSRTPPTFLMHTNEDSGVPAENSLLFALACRKAGVPVELHLYEHGQHGFGLGGNDPVLKTWPAVCAAWLKGRGFLTAK